MGLDNGIYIKSDKRIINREDLPDGFFFPFDKDYGEYVQILYWRKNWGMRDEVMQHFNWSENDDEPYLLETPRQVLEFIELVAGWLDGNRWENEGRSIWEYQEMRPVLVKDIINLTLAYGIMLRNPDIYLQFYDSY